MSRWTNWRKLTCATVGSLPFVGVAVGQTRNYYLSRAEEAREAEERRQQLNTKYQESWNSLPAELTLRVVTTVSLEKEQDSDLFVTLRFGPEEDGNVVDITVGELRQANFSDCLIGKLRHIKRDFYRSMELFNQAWNGLSDEDKEGIQFSKALNPPAWDSEVLVVLRVTNGSSTIDITRGEVLQCEDVESLVINKMLLLDETDRKAKFEEAWEAAQFKEGFTYEFINPFPISDFRAAVRIAHPAYEIAGIELTLGDLLDEEGLPAILDWTLGSYVDSVQGEYVVSEARVAELLPILPENWQLDLLQEEGDKFYGKLFVARVSNSTNETWALLTYAELRAMTSERFRQVIDTTPQERIMDLVAETKNRISEIKDEYEEQGLLEAGANQLRRCKDLASYLIREETLENGSSGSHCNDLMKIYQRLHNALTILECCLVKGRAPDEREQGILDRETALS